MSNTLTLTAENFDEAINTGPTAILVDFWASWCGPCRAIAPVLDAMADDMSDILRVGKVDVDAESGLAGRYAVRSIPTMILFRDGEPVTTLVGALPRHQLEEAIRKHLT